MNSDISIKKLKGINRPIIPQRERKIVLDEIKCIDHIIIFDTTDSSELIFKIKPDVLVLGEEYRNRDFKESHVANMINCKIKFCEKRLQVSTSELIEKIKNL